MLHRLVLKHNDAELFGLAVDIVQACLTDVVRLESGTSLRLRTTCANEISCVRRNDNAYKG